MRNRRFFALITLGLMLLGQNIALALEPPTGKVVLTITGKVGQTNHEDEARFDMSMLAALPQHTFTATTPWYTTPIKVTGPRLRDVLAAAGVSQGKLTAVALNDYKTSIPVEDALKYDVIIARLMNDKPMPVRDKGPLFIIYPFDSDKALAVPIYYERSAWQLKQLIVE